MSTQPLVAPCTGCGRPNGVYHAHRDEHLCPRCGNLYEVGDLAELHLQQLLNPVIDTWRLHWLERGVSLEVLDELLRHFSEVDWERTPLRYNQSPKFDAAVVVNTWQAAA